MCTKLGNMYRSVVKLKQEVEELKRYLEPLGQQASPRLKDLRFPETTCFSRVFVFPSEIYETLYHKLKNYLFGSMVATIENEASLHAIAKVEDKEIIESVVKEGRGEILQIPSEDLTLREFIGVADDKIHNLDEELTKLRGEIESKTRENSEKLVLFREALSAENERLSVLEIVSQF